MSQPFSSLKRDEVLKKMQNEEFDLLIIGGGITGAGIALDAASRGMKVALVEMQDFAAGTSSRSSKMIHGGLRYLKKLEVKIVSEVGKERAIVYENGPHVTTPEWMIMPIYKGAKFGRFLTSIGLRLYDFLAGVKKSERKNMLTKEQVLQMEPKFKQDGLVGGGRFVEYRSDDVRLTIEVMKEAASLGATVINYTKVTDFIYQEGKLVGVSTIDQLNDQVSEIRAKKTVNAAGPWVDNLREKDRSLKHKKLHLTKGIHLVFDQRVFPLKQAVYFDTPDKRMILIIPRDGKTYVGTTDTAFKGDLVHPRMTANDRDYIINAIHFIFPDLELKASDIESSWAGVRPLIHEAGKGHSEISRKDEIWESESGLVTIAGGKLTGYRKMAEKIVDLLSSQFKQEDGTLFSSCKTKKMSISGGHVGGSQNFLTFAKDKMEQGIAIGLNKETSSRLVNMYGSNIEKIFELIQQNEKEAETFGLPVDLYAQVLYSLTEEFAYTPVDFFLRRTGALLFDLDWVKKWQTPVIEMMSKKLGWSSKQKESFQAELEKQWHDLTVPIDEE
ncbi:glycerol-3-phosphate dehydrogenase/oxidase [Bacillus sp. V3B]|uniref:glycerol-3-phosphate dehydrogenase/oxidase n=1 Tax=Bacillus sp. V3B TaxID=2804915 RepID=UPI002736BCAC|nr:glycerol-3-phosphate dehydrogenase/oxidase [Bacillus sp. V3B]MCQ6276979.1 glycerol-3-phosphate dehydrogenase/oxidase [Bacillus sp. V3B]